MGNIIISWREVLLAGVLVLVVYIAELLLFLRASGSEIGRPAFLGVFRKKRAVDDTPARLKHLGERLDALEMQMQSLVAEKAAAEASPYQRAIQMARQGRDAARISEGCGISFSEAELIVSLHGSHKSPAESSS